MTIRAIRAKLFIFFTGLLLLGAFLFLFSPEYMYISAGYDAQGNVVEGGRIMDFQSTLWKFIIYSLGWLVVWLIFFILFPKISSSQKKLQKK